MIALAALSHDRADASCVEAFGVAALSLRERTLRRLGVSLDELTGRGQRGRAGAARQELAYLLWTQCLHLSLGQVAKLIGRGDHAAAIYAIMAGARARGIVVAKVSDLREGGGSDALDWTKLAYAAAGYRETQGWSLEATARRAGISRAEWRKVEQGRSVSAGAMLRVCRTIGADPFAFLSCDTHETPVKHRGDA